MIPSLKPYPNMKPSGVPWLGEVPERWEVRRIKTLFREKDSRSQDGNGVLLSLTKARGLLPQSEASNRLASAADLSKYKVCRRGDLVMNRMQAWSGMFAMSSLDGLVSPDYSVFVAIERLEVQYFEHLFKTPILVDQFAQASKGIGSGFNRLYTPDFGAVPVAIPPLHEQAAIVRFLDFADRRIRRYVRAKQKLIKLLEEQKQAITHRAVTRGLDPNVRLKPSGVEWLGDVPEHWEVRRLKTLFREKDERGGDGNGLLLSLTRARGLLPQAEASTRLASATDLSKYKVCRPNELVMNRMQAWSGMFAVSSYEGLVSPDYAVFNAIERMEIRFFEQLFKTPVAVNQFAQASKGIGSGFNRLYTPDFGAIPVAFPPVPEQAAIVNFLDDVIESLMATIDRARREISLLREYRTRLIADVVTGKLDVREAAARLPDEVDEEPLNDVEAEGESDETDIHDADEVMAETEA